MPITATYHLHVPAANAEAFAQAVLLEQTVETPRHVALRYPFVRDHLMGSLDAVEVLGETDVRVQLTLSSLTAAVDPAQLLNVLIGNASLYPTVTLESFSLPAEVQAQYAGPRFGMDAWRALTGVYDRPLVCSALKPVGMTLDEMEGVLVQMALGGIDVVKDDHYLADHPFAPFETRVRRMLDVTARVADRTGRRTLYVPNLSGTPEGVKAQAAQAQALGAQAVMVAPLLVGLPFLHELTTRHLDVPLLAHPSFSGHAAIAPPALIGRLFRLYGADAVIFAGYGGRFSMPEQTCRAIAAEARAPWSALLPALPVPAGGMTRERASELVTFYGLDTMLLVGGSLLEAGDRLTDEARVLIDQTAAAARALSDA